MHCVADQNLHTANATSQHTLASALTPQPLTVTFEFCLFWDAWSYLQYRLALFDNFFNLTTVHILQPHSMKRKQTRAEPRTALDTATSAAATATAAPLHSSPLAPPAPAATTGACFCSAWASAGNRAVM